MTASSPLKLRGSVCCSVISLAVFISICSVISLAVLSWVSEGWPLVHCWWSPWPCSHNPSIKTVTPLCRWTWRRQRRWLWCLLWGELAMMYCNGLPRPALLISPPRPLLVALLEAKEVTFDTVAAAAEGRLITLSLKYLWPTRLTTRQNNFLVVGGSKIVRIQNSKSLKLKKQIYETLNIEIFYWPGLGWPRDKIIFSWWVGPKK